ncbi:DUF262 domain-containing protein [uncultured Chryseobacterium sp.]|uniref:DUF262 domain-containing protein n=1 Tax=uncultured Chryseobacterium sp. TaxID=259322 RepID=UPI002585D5A7|nr:DUF262 domain-containing protein [uncultured Chryseobacterium sp.]
MATIKTYPFQNSSILRINSEKDFINTHPDYQRKGEVWNKQKKQLLIDSILNDYDIPKLYFHQLSLQQKSEHSGKYDYAIVDGRQRLEAIWGFINGDFKLSDDFLYLADESIKANNMSYSDLASKYPKLKIRFDSYNLPIILIETEDYDLIEDMFSRLNEAVPLNAAEKRNALGGEMAKVIRDLAEHPVFINKVKFSNSRYQYREVSARLLFLLYSLNVNKKILDTKKAFLDKMVITFKENKSLDASPYYNESVQILNLMQNVFNNKDSLLRGQANMTIYFLVFKNAKDNLTVSKITREKIDFFYKELEINRKKAEEDITEANFEYLEFERLSQQGTNDSVSIRERTKILSEYLAVL